MKIDFWLAIAYSILTLAAAIFDLRTNETFSYIRFTVGSALSAFVVGRYFFARSLE